MKTLGGLQFFELLRLLTFSNYPQITIFRSYPNFEQAKSYEIISKSINSLTKKLY